MKEILFEKCAENEFMMNLLGDSAIGKRYTCRWVALYDIIMESNLTEEYNHYYKKYKREHQNNS